MPSYNFINTVTNEEFTEFLSFSELDTFLESNPDVRQVPSLVSIVSGVDGIRRPDDGFRDLVKEMKKKHKKGNFGQFNP